MTRYIIIGAGAVGASLAAEFQQAGIDYALVGRGRQIKHIQEHGLEYRRPDGTKHHRLNAFDISTPPSLHTDDVLFLTVKTQDVEQAAREWVGQPVEGSTTETAADLPIVTFQNGLAAEDIALRYFQHVYAASILTPALFLEVGKVAVAGNPQVGVVTVGRYPSGSDEIAAQIAVDLTAANYISEARDDIRRWKSAKLLHNVRNAVELFAGNPDQLTHAGDELSREASSVLKAAGFDPAAPSERKIGLNGWGPAENSGVERGQQSTWQSFSRGSSSEVDFLNGEIVKLGRFHAIPTPFNSAIQQAAAKLSRLGSAPRSIDIAEALRTAQADGPDHERAIKTARG
ncbi:ketopantoate reductase family protein [Agrobacterium sp. rho-13.3]|uniref:ketopantoate reductase family protein n=1 Tax=Agrobacterium sp. rho-13.3 TaxID=3072980 RepID=UPI002A0E142F|nr:2-dehydropantoate 2-reductase N-terminal domain-containing protein [Agrobacterium sp. rho-13.3]MDX8306635.1 2-dehydropantoate 2-reductase N-terminal domain-containing protein [Agrobacterium sp. rho-13.3]MDX8307034.1 2-dehydropantoate 2-reductase N-terminal domain-containing protein [Agrobacterium sp. rho-13.3]